MGELNHPLLADPVSALLAVLSLLIEMSIGNRDASSGADRRPR